MSAHTARVPPWIFVGWNALKKLDLRAYSLHEIMNGRHGPLGRGDPMLDPWIIEEIKRREREENHRQPAVVEFPLHGPQETN